MMTYGPVSSRRLGLSLGINNIPSSKICSYNCIYCQVGHTKRVSVSRETFYQPSYIKQEVESHLKSIENQRMPDYLTIVSNGEPTLDINLGKTIKELKGFDIPIAVITNASLISNADVVDDLSEADWVSVKVDAANEPIWRSINKPSKDLSFQEIIEGIESFSRTYKGILNTESMIVADRNDCVNHATQLAQIIACINPHKSYISIPIRPPANSSVKEPAEEQLNQIYQIFINHGLNAELLNNFELIDLGNTGNAVNDILNITSVHPLRKEAMSKLLLRNDADWNLVNDLIYQNLIKEVDYKGQSFYMRKYTNL